MGPTAQDCSIGHPTNIQLVRLDPEDTIVIFRWQHCRIWKYLLLLLLNFKLQHFLVRQLAGPDRSGNFPDRIDLKHNLSQSDGQTSCLLSHRPTINKKVPTLADLKLHRDLKFGPWLPLP